MRGRVVNVEERVSWVVIERAGLVECKVVGGVWWGKGVSKTAVRAGVG